VLHELDRSSVCARVSHKFTLHYKLQGEENNDAGSHNAATRGRGGPAKKARTAQAQVPASNTIMSFFARIPSAPMSSQ